MKAARSARDSRLRAARYRPAGQPSVRSSSVSTACFVQPEPEDAVEEALGLVAIEPQGLLSKVRELAGRPPAPEWQRRIGACRDDRVLTLSGDPRMNDVTSSWQRASVTTW